VDEVTGHIFEAYLTYQTEKLLLLTTLAKLQQKQLQIDLNHSKRLILSWVN